MTHPLKIAWGNGYTTTFAAGSFYMVSAIAEILVVRLQPCMLMTPQNADRKQDVILCDQSPSVEVQRFHRFQNLHASNVLHTQLQHFSHVFSSSTKMQLVNEALPTIPHFNTNHAAWSTTFGILSAR